MGILWCSFGCIWELLNGWIDDSDLPELQSIDLNSYALHGAYSDRQTISEEPYNYKNTLTMRSETEWNDEWIDLPSLTSFKGYGGDFRYIGSVVLESSHMTVDWTRYSSVIIQWNPIRWFLLLLHLFPPILKYSFSLSFDHSMLLLSIHLSESMVILCHLICLRYSHRRKLIWLLLISCMKRKWYLPFN